MKLNFKTFSKLLFYSKLFMFYSLKEKKNAF